MMQESPITHVCLRPVEAPIPKGPIAKIVDIAMRIRSYIIKNAPGLLCLFQKNNFSQTPNSLFDEDSIHKDRDYIQAQKYSWAVLSYEKIMQRGQLKSAPSPGNGYFDTVQILFEQVEILSRKLKISENIDRKSHLGLIEKLFPGMPALTRGLYPAILYFVAMRIKNGGEGVQFLQNDYWNVIMEPSNEMYLASCALIEETDNLFDLLRRGSPDGFDRLYLEFERVWSNFYDQLEEEVKNPFCFISPDLEIAEILKLLPKNELYKKNTEEARRIAGYFGNDASKVPVSISIYPRRPSDSYENNRAYIHAQLFIRQASKNLNNVCMYTLKEVNILKFPKNNINE
jgi:hypothetical protein